MVNLCFYRNGLAKTKKSIKKLKNFNKNEYSYNSAIILASR